MGRLVALVEQVERVVLALGSVAGGGLGVRCRGQGGLLGREVGPEVDLAAQVGDDRVPRLLLVIGKTLRGSAHVRSIRASSTVTSGSA